MRRSGFIAVAGAFGALTVATSGCARHTGAEPGGTAAPAAVTVETAKAVVRPVETTVTAQGTLTPAQGASVKITATSSGRIATVSVREGDSVRAGEVVAMLDPRPASAGERSASAGLRAAEAQAAAARSSARAAATDQAGAVQQARLALAAARVDRENAVRQARTGLQAAEAELAKVRAGARPQEIAQAEQAVRQAQATRERAATEAERVRFLYGAGVEPKRALDDVETALSVAESTLASAKAQADLVRAGARPQDIRAAQLQVRAAREAVAQARAGGDARVKAAEATVRQAEQGAAQVVAKRQEAASMADAADQKRADLAAAQTALGTTVVRSPIAGVVTRRSADPGDMADPATPILEIADTGTLDLLARIPAEQGAGVRPGQAARVSDGATNATGRVRSVGSVDPQTNLLSVRIAVANPGGKLKIGTFVTAHIVVHTDPRGLVVPKEAVVSRGGKNVVFTVSGDGTAHERTVTLGPEEGGDVQVRRGLQPGDTVIRVGQYELADGAKVKPAGGQAP